MHCDYYILVLSAFKAKLWKNQFDFFFVHPSDECRIRRNAGLKNSLSIVFLGMGRVEDIMR